jgi:glutaredoxin-like protein
MALLSEEVLGQLRQAFVGLTGPVKLVVFTQEMECQYCRENRMLAEEVAQASDKIALEVYNFVLDKPQVEKYGIERIPAIVVEGARDYGIRFYGIPAGYEFASLVEAIKIASSASPGLSASTLQRLAEIRSPVRIRVFVTLTCPYCAPQVHLAHRLALASDMVRAEMIESAEFPELAHRFNVMGVPKTVVNDTHQFEGAIPEETFVERLLAALQPASA